tara:strand:+ start:2747 stop:3037 length:291 start_codon:yes stop_codon:yes gene_type:complete
MQTQTLLPTRLKQRRVIHPGFGASHDFDTTTEQLHKSADSRRSARSKCPSAFPHADGFFAQAAAQSNGPMGGELARFCGIRLAFIVKRISTNSTLP